jgi:hypothetical protein
VATSLTRVVTTETGQGVDGEMKHEDGGCCRSVPDGPLPGGLSLAFRHAVVFPSLVSPARLSRAMFVALVAVLPLHTVSVHAWVSWKMWMVLLIVVALLDIAAERRWPWSPRLTAGVAAFLLVLAASLPGAPSASFVRLWLAAALGGLLLLVVARHALGRLDDVLRAVFWSGTAMAITGLLVGLATNGTFGDAWVFALNDLALVDRVNKPAYLADGFVAVTNWHVEPGYSATWCALWLMLALLASARGVGSGRRWFDGLVIGGLAVVSGLAYSRTGLGLLVLALAAALFVGLRDPRFELRQVMTTAISGILAGLALFGLVVALDPPGVGGDVLVALAFRIETLGELGVIDVGEEGMVDPGLVVQDNRLEVWREYLGRFAGSPLRGIGLGTGWAEEGLQEPHNLLVQIMAESGLIGLLGLSGLVYSLGRGGGVVAGSALAIALVAGLTQTVLFEPIGWFAAGLWAAERATFKTAAFEADAQVAT